MKNKKIFKVVLQGIALVLVIVGVFYLAQFVKGSETVRSIVLQYGYIGIFLVSLVGGFNLMIPIPAVTFLPVFLEAGLHFWISIVFIVLGTTVADFIAYFVGKFGRRMTLHAVDGAIFQGLEKIRACFRWAPLVALFLFVSFVPLSNELLLIPIGFLGYAFHRVFPIVVAGNFLFNTMYASGIVNILEVL